MDDDDGNGDVVDGDGDDSNSDNDEETDESKDNKWDDEKGVDVDDDAFVQVEAIIRSMTPKERTNPKILDSSRKKRVARGSGTQIEDVNKLIKQFDEMKKVMNIMSKGGRGRMQMPGLGKR